MKKMKIALLQLAAKLASEGKVKIIVKGHIHTDILMKAVLKRNLNLIGKKRLSHVWHMTLDELMINHLLLLMVL